MCSESRHSINKASFTKREVEGGILIQKWTQFGMTKGAYLLKIALCLWHNYFPFCREDVFSPCSVSLFISSPWTRLFVSYYSYLWLSTIWISSTLMKSYVLSKPYPLAETQWPCIVPFMDADTVDKIRQEVVWWKVIWLILQRKAEFC